MIILGNICTPVQALIDSGSAGNFIDVALVQKLAIDTAPCIPPLCVSVLDDWPLGAGPVQQIINPILIQVGALHPENIQLFVTDTPTNSLILGFPWLVLHDPAISWRDGDILKWSPSCFHTCMKVVSPVFCHSTQVFEMPAKQAHNVPHVYQDWHHIFDKAKATDIPPHCPQDCAIDLLPGTHPPKSRIYPLSIPETKAMEDYVEENLKLGFIRPSTSLAASGFFFVEKKDGSLRPCIDYRGLNAITVKLPFPLPLVPAAIEQIREARIFSKLDLRCAYNLIRICEGDEWKTAFITNSGHCEYLVMPFGLSNSPSVFQSFRGL